MNYGHLHSCTASSVAANLLLQDLGKSAVFLCQKEHPWPSKNSKQKLFIANEIADSLEEISNMHFINSTVMLNESQSHLMFIIPRHIHYSSVGSFSDHDFLNWLCCLVMWFYLNLEENSCCSMSNSSGKDTLGRKEIKSMSESSEALPYFEFP